MTYPRLMTYKEVQAAIADNNPLVIESRKYGIVANWYTTRDKAEFAEWLRGRMEAGAYPEREYGRSWRAWNQNVTREKVKAEPWG